ncbi:amidase [Paenibacillus sp. HN-1]|uniref:amidase family protein n=1 Tax=Paenibacillus TaxID=44249 RepID=UPI001CA7ED2D|nr:MULTISPECIES: amidase family protein [Paenibacillus]MBY9080829.1 amidase [Paenibacillus sp. CGMCC 1.18879]MBY9085179.1 amidase [Paenibacillus sinensis]
MGLDNRFGAFINPGLEVSPLGSGPLSGTSFAVKDVFAVRGHASSAGNPDWLRSHPAASGHAAAVLRLLEAGASLTGAAHTDELMYSLGGENIHYGTPINPKGIGRIPGGSSSGSAVAVSAGDVDFAIGTDTGGSVRVPSSYCGIYGFRPSHGAVDMSGVIPLAPGFDTVGWMAGSPELLLRVGKALLPREKAQAEETGDSPRNPVFPYASGSAVSDATLPPEENGNGALSEPGITKLYMVKEAWALIDPGCAGAWDGALRHIQASVMSSAEAEISPEGLKAWMDIFRELQGSQIWDTHGDWIRSENPVFAPDIAARFALAEELARQDHSGAEALRGDIVRRLTELLGEDGALVIPTVPGPAPLAGGDAGQLERNRSGAMLLCCIAGLAGLPQITLPVDGPGGLPLGLSIIGGPGQDLRLLGWASRSWRQASV